MAAAPFDRPSDYRWSKDENAFLASILASGTAKDALFGGRWHYNWVIKKF